MTHHLHGATLLYARVITRASHAQVTGTCMRKWDSQERACALAYPCWGQPADCETRWAREALQCVCSASMLGGLQPQASSRGRTADALLTWIPGHRSPLLRVRRGREWRVCVPHGLEVCVWHPDCVGRAELFMCVCYNCYTQLLQWLQSHVCTSVCSSGGTPRGRGSASMHTLVQTYSYKVTKSSSFAHGVVLPPQT